MTSIARNLLSVRGKWWRPIRLTLGGIPPDAHEYRLGNRSALAWVIDQYRVERDKDDEIISDQNPPDDEEAIVRLVGQVITVSVETMRIIRDLPNLKLP